MEAKTNIRRQILFNSSAYMSSSSLVGGVGDNIETQCYCTIKVRFAVLTDKRDKIVQICIP